MKAKPTTPQKKNPTEPARASLPEWIGEDPALRYSLIKQIMPFLGIGKAPSAIDCQELNLTAHLRANAIAEFIALADEGLKEQGSFTDETLPWLADALRFELQIAHLTATTLFELYKKDVEAAARFTKPA
jgi:hypothetical protein